MPGAARPLFADTHTADVPSTAPAAVSLTAPGLGSLADHDSGTSNGPVANTGTPAAANLPPIQLYNLASDIGETRNVQAEHPEVVARLTKLLEKYVADGRSTPGATQKNDVEVLRHPRETAPTKAKRK